MKPSWAYSPLKVDGSVATRHHFCFCHHICQCAGHIKAWLGKVLQSFWTDCSPRKCQNSHSSKFKSRSAFQQTKSYDFYGNSGRCFKKTRRGQEWVASGLGRASGTALNCLGPDGSGRGVSKPQGGGACRVPCDWQWPESRQSGNGSMWPGGAAWEPSGSRSRSRRLSEQRCGWQNARPGPGESLRPHALSALQVTAVPAQGWQQAAGAFETQPSMKPSLKKIFENESFFFFLLSRVCLAPLVFQ